MSHDAFRYDFTIRELLFFLFEKPACLQCNTIMNRRKAFEILPGSEFNTRSAAPFREHSRVKHYYYVYTCPKCGASYKLSEIMCDIGVR